MILLDELKDQVQTRMEAYRQRLTRYHAKKVHPREFLVGDLDLRRAMDNKKELNSKKLGATGKVHI